MELAQQLAAQQGSADRNSQAGTQAAGQARQRALAAMAAAGQAAGAVRGQDFGENAAKAAAQDEVNKYNTGLRQNTNQFNSNAKDKTFQNQLGKQDRITDQLNIGQQRYMEEAERVRGLHRGQGKRMGNVSRAWGQAGDSMTGGGLMSGGGEGGGGMSFLSDETKKKNIQPEADDELLNFLDKLGANKYEYKDESNGKGKRFGPMAQELEKSEIGKSMVKDTPEGKKLDVAGVVGATTAATAAVRRKQKELELELAKMKRKKEGK